MRRKPYINLMKGLIGAWCPSLGATGRIAIDRTKYHRDLTLTTYENGQGYGARGTGMAFDFQPSFGGAYTYDVSKVPDYSTGQQITVSGWHSLRSLYDGDLYYWNNAIFEIVTSYYDYGQRLILQSTYDPDNNITYVFTDGVFAENNLYIQGAPTLNQWYHYCIVITDQEYRFYLDGNLNQYGMFGFDYLLDPAYFLNVGYRDGYDNYDGHIDDVRLYNRALTGAEVKELASRRGVGLEQRRVRRSVLSLGDTHDGSSYSPYLVWPEKKGKKKPSKPKKPRSQKGQTDDNSELLLEPPTAANVVAAAVDGLDLSILRERFELLSVQAELELLEAAQAQLQQQLAAAAADAEQRERERVALARIEELVAQHHKRLEAERAEVADIVDLLDSDLWTALEVFDFSARTYPRK